MYLYCSQVSSRVQPHPQPAQCPSSGVLPSFAGKGKPQKKEMETYVLDLMQEHLPAARESLDLQKLIGKCFDRNYDLLNSTRCREQADNPEREKKYKDAQKVARCKFFIEHDVREKRPVNRPGEEIGGVMHFGTRGVKRERGADDDNDGSKTLSVVRILVLVAKEGVHVCVHLAHIR